MAFERYNEIWICTAPNVFKSIIKEGTHAGNRFGIAIRSEMDIDEVLRMMNQVLALQKAQFCLWIDERTYREHEEKFAKLFFLLYATGYLLNYNQAVVYLVNNGAEEHECTRKHLFNSVSDPGFIPYIIDVQAWCLSGIHANCWFVRDDLDAIVPEELSLFYFNQLTKNFFVSRNIFLFISDETRIQDISSALFETEEKIFRSNTGLHELFQQYRLLTAEREKLINEKRQLEIDLTNQKRYLAVLRKEKEMEKIIEFYHGEYEVLPLWYKRLGHVIKFITGKRKLRRSQNQE